jgi:hypothetical protein
VVLHVEAVVVPCCRALGELPIAWIDVRRRGCGCAGVPGTGVWDKAHRPARGVWDVPAPGLDRHVRGG